MATEQEVARLLHDTLPASSFIRCFTEYAFTITDAPSVFMMHGGIQALLSVVPTSMSIQLGVPIRPNSFTLLVGLSGESRKTTAIQWATRIIGKAYNDEYLLLDAASPESIVRLLGEQNNRLIPITEGGDWLGRTARGQYLHVMRDNFTRLYDGLPVGHQVKQKKKSLKSVYDHHVSVFMGCTPRHLEEHTRRVDYDGGLMNRFMIVRGDREREYSSPRVDDAGEAWLGNALLEKRECTSGDARMVGFTSAAASEWKEWSTRTKAFLAKLADHERTAVARATTHALKLMQIAAVDCDVAVGEWQMPEKCVRFASQVTDWAMVDMLETYASISGNRYEMQRQQILDALIHFENRQQMATGYSAIANAIKPRLSKRDLAATLESMLAEGTLYLWQTPGGLDRFSRFPAPSSTDEMY